VERARLLWILTDDLQMGCHERIRAEIAHRGLARVNADAHIARFGSQGSRRRAEIRLSICRLRGARRPRIAVQVLLFLAALRGVTGHVAGPM
jgi:hypothetical protein